MRLNAFPATKEEEEGGGETRGGRGGKDGAYHPNAILTILHKSNLWRLRKSRSAVHEQITRQTNCDLSNALAKDCLAGTIIASSNRNLL